MKFLDSAIRAHFARDSENRLIEVRPTRDPDPNDVKVTYAYDYRGRRFERKKYTAAAAPNEPNTVEYELTEHRKFLYDGERLLLELVVDPNDPNDPNSDTVDMKYTWGLDLLSQFSGGATVRGSGGGIGALLAVWDADDPNGVHAVLHDANGNVVEVLSPATDPNDPNTAIVAHYEYDVYGNRTNPLDPNDPNDTEFEQPFRYASKWRDPDTGLVDFGRRWYFADHGRWLNRDPIGTAGGVNIYAYVMNSPANQIDPLGLAWLPCPYADGCPPLYGASPFCPSDSGGGGGGDPAPEPSSPSQPCQASGTCGQNPLPPDPFLPPKGSRLFDCYQLCERQYGLPADAPDWIRKWDELEACRTGCRQAHYDGGPRNGLRLCKILYGRYHDRHKLRACKQGVEFWDGARGNPVLKPPFRLLPRHFEWRSFDVKCDYHGLATCLMEQMMESMPIAGPCAWAIRAATTCPNQATISLLAVCLLEAGGRGGLCVAANCSVDIDWIITW